MESKNDVTEAELSEYSILSSMLSCLLLEVDFPVSVSFLNTILNGTIKNRCLITQTFMQLYKSSFSFLLIGNDLKIQVKENANIKKYSPTKDFITLRGIVEKDIASVKSLREKLNTSNKTLIKYEDFMKYASRKKAVNFPFILRNSHSFKIISDDQETYIKALQDKEENITLNEKQLWEKISKENFQGLFLFSITNILVEFFTPLHLGTLQSAFNYGSIVLDKTFTSLHYKEFHIDSDGIILAPDYRETRNKKNKNSSKRNNDTTLATESLSRNNDDANVNSDRSHSIDDLQNTGIDSDEDPERSDKTTKIPTFHLTISDDVTTTTNDVTSLDQSDSNVKSNNVTVSEDLHSDSASDDVTSIDEADRCAKILDAVKRGNSIIVVGSSSSSQTEIFYLDETDELENQKQKWKILEDLLSSLKRNDLIMSAGEKLN